MDEITEITDYIQEAAGSTADVIWGHGYDNTLGEKISITLIAAGLKDEPINGFEKAPERTVVDLHGDNSREITNILNTPVSSVQDSDIVNSEKFSEEPFLKSDKIIDNTIPVVNFSTDSEEKKSFDLFESAVEIKSSAILDVTEDTNFVEETAIFEIDQKSDINENSSGQVEFIWNVELGDDLSSSNLNSSDSIIDEKDIVKHILEDDSVKKIELDSSDKTLSPENHQKLSQERVSKIHEFTQKLKNADGISEFENEPAFVRRNISLNQNVPSSEESVSRFGLSEEEDGKSGLRSNNFLHDNVD
jgi:cell division protein FtsZ